jgi:hypothetical protein
VRPRRRPANPVHLRLLDSRLYGRARPPALSRRPWPFDPTSGGASIDDGPHRIADEVGGHASRVSPSISGSVRAANGR